MFQAEDGIRDVAVTGVQTCALPISQDLLTTYKLGWKTAYYQNTYDAKSDIDEPVHPVGWHDGVEETPKEKKEDEEDCEACTI